MLQCHVKSLGILLMPLNSVSMTFASIILSKPVWPLLPQEPKGTGNLIRHPSKLFHDVTNEVMR